jgi:hypothetical protein
MLLCRSICLIAIEVKLRGLVWGRVGVTPIVAVARASAASLVVMVNESVVPCGALCTFMGLLLAPSTCHLPNKIRRARLRLAWRTSRGKFVAA